MKRTHSWIFTAILMLVGVSLILTGGVASQSADIVVAADGNGDYTSIQTAVDNAGDTDKIKVTSGTYKQSVTIDKNVTITAPERATLTPSPSGSGFSGISIAEHATPHISGLDIDGFDVSINPGRAGATDPTNGDWKVTNIYINGSNEQYSSGIDASETSGNWTIKSVKIKNTDYGISFSSSTSNITIRDVKITDVESGITGYSTTGDWLIQNATVRNATDKGISIDHSIGSWEIASSKIQNISGDGIDAYQTDGGVISDVYINNISDENGINIVESAGDWMIKNAIIKNVDKDSGINAYNTNQSGTSKIKKCDNSKH